MSLFPLQLCKVNKEGILPINTVFDHLFAKEASISHNP